MLQASINVPISDDLITGFEGTDDAARIQITECRGSSESEL